MSQDGVQQIKIDSAIRFNHASISTDLVVATGANSIKWKYSLNTQVQSTIGGEVTQLLSAYVGPMMIQGIAKDRIELNKIKDWFLQYMELAGTSYKGQWFRNEMAVKFSYPARGWSFYLMPTNFEGFRYDKEVYAIPWQLTAEIVDDNALNYLSGVTMTAFTGPLANPALVTVGYSDPTGTGKASRFVNPLLNADIPQLAATMGENFQRLVSNWASGNFADFAYGSLTEGISNPTLKDPKTAYQDLFGTPGLSTASGGTTSSAGGGGTGTVTYNASSQLAAGAGAAWIKDLLVNLGVPYTTANQNFMYSWWLSEGGDTNGAKFNWLNTTLGSQYPSFNSVGVRIYPNESTGITETAATIKQSNFSDIYAALKSGDPYANPPIKGLETWVAGPGGVGTQHALDYANKILGRFSTPATTGSTAVPSAVAKQLLAQYGKGWTDDDGLGKQQIQDTANGKQLNGPAGPVTLDAQPMQLILALIARGYTIGTTAWCTNHSLDSTNGHAGGKAVDISSISGIPINANSGIVRANVIAVDTAIRSLGSLLPRQLITAGYGNHSDSTILALTITDPPGQDPVSYYGSDTLAQHENHIHAGF